MSDIGIRLKDSGPGFCESILPISSRHLQHNKLINAGVQATIAGHTAGGAATTAIREDQSVLTVEFKINLLRPASGDSLHCKSQILKSGKMLIVVESQVHTGDSTNGDRVSKAIVTLAVVSKEKYRL